MYANRTMTACDAAFWTVYSNTSEAKLLEKNFDCDGTWLSRLVDVAFYGGAARFTISLIAIIPFAACVAIGSSQKV